MGQDSDFKSQIVVEICTLSTASIACNHRHYGSPVKQHFIDWYRLIGVEENADIEVIRKQYHKLALQLHPDKNRHPKADIAFKLVLEAYSCLSDKEKREVFNLERWKYFCIECNKIPYAPSNSSTQSKEWNPEFRSKSRRNLRGLKDIGERFKEEANVMENCLRANSASRKESPLFKFNLSENLFKSSIPWRSKKESPIFDPSDYSFQGYPHVRNRVHKESMNYWCSQRNNIVKNGRQARTPDSPIFENRSGSGMFKTNSACVRS